MLMIYHSAVLERTPLPLQPFAQTVTLHVRLLPVQWHLKVPGIRPRVTEARTVCFQWWTWMCRLSRGLHPD